MDAETKQQLYGGEISDFLPKKTEKELKDDYKAIEDIYLNLKKKSLKFDARDYLDNKLE
jgi:hypothetical protein